MTTICEWRWCVSVSVCVCVCVYVHVLMIFIPSYINFIHSPLPSCTLTHLHPSHASNPPHTHVNTYLTPSPSHLHPPPHILTPSHSHLPSHTPTFSKNQSGANPLPSCSTVTLPSSPTSRHKRDVTSTDPRSKLQPCKGDRQRVRQ